MIARSDCVRRLQAWAPRFVAATLLAVFLVPLFFISVRSVFRGRRTREEPPPQSPQPNAAS